MEVLYDRTSALISDPTLARRRDFSVLENIVYNSYEEAEYESKRAIIKIVFSTVFLGKAMALDASFALKRIVCLL